MAGFQYHYILSHLCGLGVHCHKPKKSHLHPAYICNSWVTIIIPLPPRFQQDITQNYSETNSKQLGPRISRLRNHYTYMSQTVMFNITCNGFLSEGMWFEFWSHNQYQTFRWKFLSKEAPSALNRPAFELAVLSWTHKAHITIAHVAGPTDLLLLLL
jgi:hypothetical protein